MDAKIRLSQVYELQRIALINVNYYATRISHFSAINRWLQIAVAIAASGTMITAVRSFSPRYAWIGVVSPLATSTLAIIVAAFNFPDLIGKLERVHTGYRMLYHSVETLAKQTIGAEMLTPEQDAVALMLEQQLAALGPQDDIDPDRKSMKAAQEEAEKQLPASYYYPQSAQNT